MHPTVLRSHATDQTKTIIEAGKKAAKLPEIEMPDFLKKYTWFQTSQNTAGNIKIRKQIWRSINAKPMEVMAIGKN